MQRRIVYLAIVWAVAVLSVVASAEDLLVSSAGSPAVNGIYKGSGAVGPMDPAYVKGDLVLGYIAFCTKQLWVIVDYGAGFKGFYYYNNAPKGAVPTTGWEPASNAMCGGLRVGDGSMYWGNEPSPTVSSLEIKPQDLPLPLPSPIVVRPVDLQPFEGTVTLDCFDEVPDGWINIAAHPRASFSDRPGYLALETDIGSGSPRNGSAVIRDVSTSEFQIETRLEFEPTTNFQRAGLTIYGDDETYLVLSRAYCEINGTTCVGNGIYFEACGSADSFATETEIEDLAWLRLTKEADQVRAEYSTDGETWQLIGIHPFAFPGLPKVGLLADGVGPEHVMTAYFDYFRLVEP